MPIYEYRCQACGHEFEKLQKLSDPAIVDCPQCHKPEVKKLISAAGFRLKGGGWYETDFKQSGKRNLAGESGDKSAAKETSTSETKTSDNAQTKSETKTSTTPSAGAKNDKVA